MDIKKPQLVKVEAFAVIFLMRFCNTLAGLHDTDLLGTMRSVALLSLLDMIKWGVV